MTSKLGKIFLSLTVVFACVQARTLRGSPICSGATGADHLVPHPTDCHLFYSCSEDGEGGYNAYLFKCQSGLAFDDLTNRCEFEDTVPRCKQDSTTTTTTVTSTTEEEPTSTTTTLKPDTTTPEEPETTTPEEPETTTPEEPETTTPEEPETTTPEEPETTTPEEPETTTPEEPETTTPEEPETTTKEEPEPTTTSQATTTESPILNSITCENYQGSLSCDEGKVLQVVSGYYGRQERTVCTHPSIQTVSCYSNRLEYLQSECEGKNSCNFTSNNRFGDPCRNTYKYTEVQYKCV